MTQAVEHANIVKPKMKLRWLRWRLHHLALVYIVITAIGVLAFGWPWPVLVIPGVLLVWLVADGMARPGSGLFYPTVTHAARNTKRVALSFDDGPDPTVTPQVLDMLAAYGAHATFFIIGKSLAAQPELGQRMLAEGHVLGNHSWQHSRWQNFRWFRWHARELQLCGQAIEALDPGRRPWLYRPPVGLKRPELARAVWRRGLTLVAWSLHSHDTRLSDPERIAGRVLKKIRGGDIVLLHDGHDLAGRQRPQCAVAVRLILQGLRVKGMECVTIPELLNLSGGVPRPPG
ncbi:MAG: polysaccharide deacetylase family protein [Gammaproteobacteria bacterium]